MASKQQQKREHAAVDAFNERYPVGTPVRYWTMLREGPGKTGETRSTAQVLSGHTAVVWVTGQPGCIALTHVEPEQKPPARNDEELVRLRSGIRSAIRQIDQAGTLSPLDVDITHIKLDLIALLPDVAVAVVHVNEFDVSQSKIEMKCPRCGAPFTPSGSCSRKAEGCHAETRMGRRPKLTDNQVVEIRQRVAKGEEQKKLAAEYGVVPQTISDIVLRKTRKVL